MAPEDAWPLDAAHCAAVLFQRDQTGPAGALALLQPHRTRAGPQPDHRIASDASPRRWTSGVHGLSRRLAALAHPPEVEPGESESETSADRPCRLPPSHARRTR
eukprot:2375935-Rhodomonas_salina.2